ncbi:MAG: hypothetical protein ACRDOI_45015, partial [Trebonia sp.]
AAPTPPDYPQQAAPAMAPGAVSPGGGRSPARGPGGPPGAVPPPAGSAGDGADATHSFGGTSISGGDPPLPPPPPPDDEDFDPDDEDMSVPVVNQLTGMPLIQRELGGQIIAEYDD